MKFCKDCKWLCTVEGWDDLKIEGNAQCNYTYFVNDVILGKLIKNDREKTEFCRTMRKRKRLCGRKAKWFEPKKEGK